MMDFISIPLVVGIICYGIYSLFELFVHKKERLMIIEKLSEKVDWTVLDGKLQLPSFAQKRVSFSALKIGCLMAGLGLGLLIGVGIVVRWSGTDPGICYREKTGGKG